jgi:type IV secretory pathway TraG/TraD family ATPase VirD4
MDLLADSPDANAILSYVGGDNAQSQGVLSEMYSIMREILIGVFAERGTFSMREFVRRKGNRTLFIEYDLSIGSMLTPVYRLMFDLALKEALGRNKPQGNVYLICDEFKLLPHLRHIDDGVNFGRSLGVKVFAGVQSIEQLYEIYGQSRGRNIAAGFSSVYAFRSNDTATREFVSGLFGKNIVMERYQRLDNQMIEEKRNGQTVEDWDMNTLKVGEAIVGLPFSQPFRFHFDMYK